MSRWDVIMAAVTAVIVLGAIVFALSGCQAMDSNSVGQVRAANSASEAESGTVGWESSDAVGEPVGRNAASGGWTNGDGGTMSTSNLTSDWSAGDGSVR